MIRRLVSWVPVLAALSLGAGAASQMPSRDLPVGDQAIVTFRAPSLSPSQLIALTVPLEKSVSAPSQPANAHNDSANSRRSSSNERSPSTLKEVIEIGTVAYLLQKRSSELKDRVARIERIVRKKCQPPGLRDVWLDGCATRTATG